MYEKKNQGDRLMWERYHEKLTQKQEQYHEKLTQKQEQYREQLTQKQSVLRQKGEILSQKWWIRLFRSMWRRYRVHNVGLESAALAFYLVFAIFPFLIFVTVLLRIWELNLEGGLDLLAQILPAEITDIVRQFLRYASRPNVRLLVSSLVFSFWFPMRASNALMLSVRKAYHLGTPHGAAQMLKNGGSDGNRGSDRAFNDGQQPDTGICGGKSVFAGNCRGTLADFAVSADCVRGMADFISAVRACTG